MANTITIPNPEEIKRRIVARREEVRELKRLLKMSLSADNANRLATLNAGGSQNASR
jgi:hypothetical protein